VCRIVEKSYFFQDDFAEVLNRSYIEARLHSDKQDTPEAQMQRMEEKRREFVGHPGMPIYVVVDPETGKLIDKLEGFEPDPNVMLEFLKRSAEN
jgi:hypothetical protein